ncbi:MAG: class I mannose-6-phosphate isomerase [Clostridia bacterium]|nr:class I mannose-6-phosphate isomerase [Clostridia bacterium]
MKRCALQLVPSLKQAVWAGNRLCAVYGTAEPVAEAWVVSGHPNGESTVTGGAYHGLTLWQAVLAMGKDAVAEGFDGEAFPQLIKLIDAGSPLSVQVHPDDGFAMKYENSPGKTEAWWVVEAEEGATLVYGLKRPVQGEELRRAAEEGSMEELLNQVPAREGEVFFIPAGTVHAIGRGQLIAEVQQPSDVTYRLYDYNRPGADGKPRPLHLDKAMQVACCDTQPLLPEERFPEKLSVPGLFGAARLEVNGAKTLLVDARSYAALLGIEGTVKLTALGESFSLGRGECVFVPAASGEICLQGQGKCLCFGME